MHRHYTQLQLYDLPISSRLTFTAFSCSAVGDMKMFIELYTLAKGHVGREVKDTRVHINLPLTVFVILLNSNYRIYIPVFSPFHWVGGVTDTSPQKPSALSAEAGHFQPKCLFLSLFLSVVSPTVMHNFLLKIMLLIMLLYQQMQLHFYFFCLLPSLFS